MTMSHADKIDRPSDRFGEAFLTGMALGQLQVTLGVLSYRGVGASASTWFLLLLCWLVGGFVGSLLQRSDAARSTEPWTAVLATVFLWLAALSSHSVPFSAWPLVAVLVSAFLCGVLGGSFLASRSRNHPRPAHLFFHENNGFLVGFLSASVVLLLAAPLLLPSTTLLLGLARLAGHRPSRWLWWSIILGILSTSFQILFRDGGEPGWDALMTASVLNQVRPVEPSDWLFFAHPLVIPLTAPFRLFVEDPVLAVVVRESVFLGGVVCLLSLTARAVCKDTGDALLVTVCAVLLMLLAGGRYRLTLSGEEKEVALFFATLFQVLYLQHREHWDLGLFRNPRWTLLRRQVLLSVLLSLAIFAHLISGLLFVWLCVDLLFTLRSQRKDSASAQDIATILLLTTVFVLPLLIGLAVFVGQAKGLRQVFAFFFEYHLSGEFLSWPTSLGQRLLDCYTGVRTFFVGDFPLTHPVGEALASLVGFAFLSHRAHSLAPQICRRLLLWLGLLFVHFFFFQPENPEAWGPSSFGLIFLISLGLCGPARFSLFARAVAAISIAWLGFLIGQSQRSAIAVAESVRTFTGAAEREEQPIRQLTKWLSVTLESDAEILVDDRLLASYFQLYTRRKPIVRPYIGIPPSELRTRHHLTSLSLRFYVPQKSPQEIDAAIQAGRPVYLVSSERVDAEAQLLPLDGLFLSRLSRPLFTPSAQNPIPPASSRVSTEDLLANDLALAAVEVINPAVYKLTLSRRDITFSAKWKPMGVEGSESQEGFDGNNAPRCEVAARHIDRFLAAGDPQRELVPDVVLRALHRNVPCERSCKGVPRLLGEQIPATFPTINDHLVLGALTVWVEDGKTPTKFHEGLWSPQRFASEPDYRRSVSNLMAFLCLIAHGDANYADNFLVSEGPPFRVYSIDNGRSLDGIPYFTDDADPDWDPLRHLRPDQLVVPSIDPKMLARLAQLPDSSLRQRLHMTSAIDLKSGQSYASPDSDRVLSALSQRPLEKSKGLRQIGRGTFLTTDPALGGPWILQGISAQGIEAVWDRARRLHQVGTVPH